MYLSPIGPVCLQNPNILGLGWGLRFILTSSQKMLMLLIHETHFYGKGESINMGVY